MSRSLVLVLAGAAFALAAVTVRMSFDAPAQGAAAAKPPVPRDPHAAALLDSGAVRYTAYVHAEAASLRERRLARDAAGARVHRGRLSPALLAGRGRPSANPLAVNRAAARLLSAEARRVGAVPLLDVESRVAGAGAAFDGLRDALWSLDEGFVGEVDERLRTVRAELDPLRRGEGFVASSKLGVARRRRLAVALDALAWRLDLATREIAAAVRPAR